ncbi:unnamed protein product [Psylliodes chrysocephalus]|uniref:DUF7041 domain-containing protein n=1 Tax=Psylliodes chrysocephalus TaxID=3402493 RepID=A0A9P0GC64_9CUCU|nr:unnamed protein product [Psylliodes chrysocephala]
MTEHADVSKVTFRAPPFWPEKTALWFCQLESHFVLSCISKDETKFAYAVSQLEERYAAEVEDIITNPPEKDKYDVLKKKLIQRPILEEEKIQRLLGQEELGDLKPLQFLRHLRSLAEVVAELADKIYETTPFAQMTGLFNHNNPDNLVDKTVVKESILRPNDLQEYFKKQITKNAQEEVLPVRDVEVCYSVENKNVTRKKIVDQDLESEIETEVEEIEHEISSSSHTDEFLTLKHLVENEQEELSHEKELENPNDVKEGSSALVDYKTTKITRRYIGIFYRRR